MLIELNCFLVDYFRDINDDSIRSLEAIHFLFLLTIQNIYSFLIQAIS